MDALRVNLAGYKSKVEGYQSQIHIIRQQIRAVLPPDSESTSLQVLLLQELQSLRTFLLTLLPEEDLSEGDLTTQTLEQLTGTAEEWTQEQAARTLRVVQRIGSIHARVEAAVDDLRARGVTVTGADVLESVFAQYERLLRTAQHSKGALGERIQQEETATQTLSQQSSDLLASIDLLSSELACKQSLLNLTRHNESQAQARTVQIEGNLVDVKGELLQCKERIKELSVSNDQLEGELQTCMQVVSAYELQERTTVLRASVLQLESLSDDLSRQVSEAKQLEAHQQTHIGELEQQIAAKDCEDAGEKMSSVQNRLRDIMLSLESEGDGS